MSARTLTVRVGDDDLDRLDRLVGVLAHQYGREDDSRPPSQRRTVTRSDALRDLLFMWAEGQMPSKARMP